VIDGCLRCSQSCNGDAVWRATDIAEASTVAKLDRAWISSMFTTNSNLEIRSNGTPAFNRNLDKSSDTFSVKRGERVSAQYVV
jgi:hypothetical protein